MKINNPTNMASSKKPLPFCVQITYASPDNDKLNEPKNAKVITFRIINPRAPLKPFI
jgi:hypothetical protein